MKPTVPAKKTIQHPPVRKTILTLSPAPLDGGSDDAVEDAYAFQNVPGMMAGSSTFKDSFPPVVTWEKPGQYAAGVLVAMRGDVGVNKSNVYRLKDEESGRTFDLWGSRVIDPLLDRAGVQVGDWICLIYLGDAPPKPGQNPARLFRLNLKKLSERDELESGTTPF